MRCVSCGVEEDRGKSRFCRGCGAALPMPLGAAEPSRSVSRTVADPGPPVPTPYAPPPVAPWVPPPAQYGAWPAPANAYAAPRLETGGGFLAVAWRLGCALALSTGTAFACGLAYSAFGDALVTPLTGVLDPGAAALTAELLVKFLPSLLVTVVFLLLARRRAPAPARAMA